MITLLPDEHLEQLDETLRLIVSPAYTFTTDSLLLAAFSAPRRHETACDLGTGCGILPLLWCRKECGPVTAVDVQEPACAQLERSLALNGLEDRVTVVRADLRKEHPLLPRGSFDLVAMNPPYYAAGTGEQSRTDSDRQAKHETTCTLEDAAKAAARLLKNGGRFCLCQKPERLTDVLCTLRTHRLEPKRLRFASHRADTAPFLVLIEAKRGGNPGLKVEELLILQ